jgi:hypothetical protein
VFKQTIILSAFIASANCFAADEPPFIQTGKYQLPDISQGVGCTWDFSPSNTLQITFPKPFATPPVVNVSQEVPEPLYGDSYIVIDEVTKTGFRFHRRAIFNAICNEVGKVHYIAVGKHPQNQQ